MNLTDDEIITALKCCESGEPCANCPYEKLCKETDLAEAALDLINRQKAEIERLTEEHKKVSAYIKGNGWGIVSFLEFVKNQRTEAIKNFINKLEENARIEIMHRPRINLHYELKFVYIDDVKKMAEEFIGGDVE